jgi:hypothetical protein
MSTKRKSTKARASAEGVKVRGFFRVQIEENGKVIGDTGEKLIPNTVVNLGFQDYLCKLLAGSAGSKTISHVALGTGTAPGATDTSLNGEIMSSTQRKTVSPSITSSKTLQFTAAFASSDSFVTAAVTLQNIGLFNTSTAGTLFSGNTYTTSQLNTNQNVNCTYQIRFS